MLSDEEKKAIKGLEWSQQQMRLGNLPDYNQGHYADIRIVLNLIKKQSKEIEKGKEKNGILQKELNKKIDALDRAMNNPDYICKDKIKAKIEEIDEILNGQLIDKLRVYFEAQREILQSLLEEKE